MEINADNYAYRMQLANDMLMLKHSLEKVSIESTSLNKAIKDLKNNSYLPVSNEIVATPFNWGYKIENLIIHINDYDGIQYPKAKNIHRLKITLDVNIIGEYTNDKETVIDPFKHLEFNLTAEGFNSKEKYHVFSYHLDRHIDIGNKPEEIHPIYHIQVGGRRMDKQDGRNYGNSLLLDSPRIVHYPMDLILGIDFITSNFAPKLWKALRKDQSYVRLLIKSQKLAIAPFIKSLSQYFKLIGRTERCWKATDIFPQLINS